MEKNLCKCILDILEEKGIGIPPEFEENLARNAEINYEGKIPSLSSIRAVVRICNYWKKYCADENEFYKLVCTKIYTMIRIHAAVITSNQSEDTTYLGNICKLKNDVVLPDMTITIASCTGNASIYQGFGGRISKI